MIINKSSLLSPSSMLLLLSSFIIILLLSLSSSTSNSLFVTGAPSLICDSSAFCQNGTCHTSVIPHLSRTNYSLCNCFQKNTSHGFWQLDWQNDVLVASASSEPTFSCTDCLPGYFGEMCQEACPGTISVDVVCSGHGSCSSGPSGTGLCSCHNNSFDGFWYGESCDRCQEGYFGTNCLGKCNCNSQHGICSQGKDGNGTCFCNKTNTNNNNNMNNGVGGATCSECLRGFFDRFNNLTCVPCSGTCNLDNARCVQNPYQLRDPYANTAQELDPLPHTGMCYCNAGVTGTSCTDTTSCATCACGGAICRTCPNSCTSPKNGFCNNRTGACTCFSGFSGADCSVSSCPVGSSNGLICSGHGTCLAANGTCVCFSDENTTGVWNGTSCSACHEDFAGSEAGGCKVKCPTGFDQSSGSLNPNITAFCSGRGSCQVSGVCTCDSPSTQCGSACQNSTPYCEPCTNNTWGPDCENNCTCENNATCSDGRTGNGSCSCPVGFVGKNCELTCPGFSAVDNHVCSGHGSCSVMENNNNMNAAICTCQTNYSLSDCSKHCATDNIANGACSGHGYCDDGASGTGECTRCVDGYVAPSTACANTCQCNSLLPNASSSSSEKKLFGGSCQADGSCRCDLRFTGTNCDICAAGWSGSLCHVPCVNGTTSSSSSSRTCTCIAGFAGPSCDIECPTGENNNNNNPCHSDLSQGTCFDGTTGNGTCSCADGWGGISCGCNISKCKEILGEHSSCDDSTENSCMCDWNWALATSATVFQNPDATTNPTGLFTTTTAATISTSATASSNTSGTSVPTSTTATETTTVTSTTTTTTSVPPSSTSSSTTSSNTSSPSNNNNVLQCVICNASAAWGRDCEQRCPCTSGQGECNPVSGVCVCYSDRIRGFWSGALCRSCAEGYTGSKCDQPITPYLPQLPTLSSVVPSKLNSRSPVNEHIMKIYGVQKTSIGLRPFLPFGEFVSGMLTLTNKAAILTMTGEEYEPSKNQQRLSLDVATVCHPAFSVKEAAGDVDRDVRVEIGGTWVFDRRLFTFRRCLQEYNETTFNATLNTNITVTKLRKSDWGFSSLPLLQTWASSVASNGYPPAVRVSPPFNGATTSALPPEYRDCQVAYEEEGRTILSSPDPLFSNKHSLFLRRFDNTPHFCMVCQHKSRTSNLSTPKQSSTIFDENEKNHPRTLVCFQLQEYTDGRVQILMPESARVPLNETPIETVDAMYYDEKIQKLVVFGTRSEGNCLSFAVNVARFSPIGKFDFVIFDANDLDNGYESENVPVRCKQITSAFPLTNSIHQVTNPNEDGEAKEASYLTAISFVSDSGVFASSSTTTTTTTQTQTRDRARLLICNFSTFTPSTLQAIDAYANAVQSNISFNESDWFFYAQNVTSRYCIFPQSEPTGATDYTKITAISYDAVLSELYVSYGTYDPSFAPPPIGNFSSVLLKRFFIDTSKGILEQNETKKFVSEYYRTSSSRSMMSSSSSNTNNNNNITQQDYDYLSPIRLSGVQDPRPKGRQGHSSSFVGVYARQLFLAEFGVDRVLNRNLNVERISLIYVDSVKPRRVDARGGTELTIAGRGFGTTYRRIAGDDSTRAVPQCRVGSVIGAARIADTNTAYCQTVQRTTDGCSTTETVSVSMDAFAFAYSTQQIQRQETPALKRLTPSSGRFASPMKIIVSGDNLADYGFTRCLYIVLVKNGTAVTRPENYTVIGRANPSNPTEIECDAAPILSVPWNGQLDVSLDETVWTGSPLPVQLFGIPANIRMRAPRFTVTSAPLTLFPTVLVDIVDSVNQVVTSNVLPIPVYAEISVRNYSADIDAADPNSAATLEGTTGKIFELQNFPINSPAILSFTDLFLETPPSGIMNFALRLRPTEQNSAINFDWTTTARVSIQPGAFERISILRQPSDTIDPIGQLAQEPQISPVDAAGNNLNLNSFDGIILGVAVIERALPRISTLPSNIVAAFVAPTNRNQTVICARGGCDLSALDPIQARSGYVYTYYIWEISRPSVFLETRVMRPTCSTGSFKPLGGYNCEACIEHATCDETGNIIVDPGYWRANDFTLNVYQCFPDEACPGGNESASCAEGYIGPRCAICEASRGKSVTDRCQPCDTLSKVTFVLSLIIVSVSIICFVIYVVQNWDDPDRHVTTLQLALTQCQLIVAMTDLDYDYPGWYRELQQWIALFSDLRVFESSNADCTLRPEGATFYSRFATYVCTPIMAFIVAGLGWIILYLNPMLFRFSNNNRKDGKEQALLSKKDGDDGEGGTGDFSNNVTETITERLRRRWKRKQLAEHKTEEDEIKTALHDLLAGSGDEDEDEIENERIMAALHGAQPKRKLKNPPMPRTGIAFLMVTAQQVILFFMYPSTIQYSLSMQNCLEVEDSTTGKTLSYLKVDPTISCDTTTYEAFRSTALVFGLGMLFGVPIIYIAAHYIHGRLRPTRRRERAQMFSFLMQGVRPRRWYYPAFIFLRKGVSTAIASYFTKPLDGYFTMWGLVFYLPMVYYLKPYLRWHHNALEALAIAATIVSINLSLILYAIPDNATVRTACSALIVILLSCVLLVFAFISSAEHRYILWGRVRIFFGHITESEDENEFDNGPSEAAAKKAAEALDEMRPSDFRAALTEEQSEEPSSTGTGRAQITYINEKKQAALAERERKAKEDEQHHHHISSSSSTKNNKNRTSSSSPSKPVTIEDIEDDVDDVDNFAIAVEEAARATQLDKLKRDKRAILKQELVASGKFDEDSEEELEILDAAGPDSSMLLKDKLLLSSSSSASFSQQPSVVVPKGSNNNNSKRPSAEADPDIKLHDDWDKEYFKDQYNNNNNNNNSPSPSRSTTAAAAAKSSSGLVPAIRQTVIQDQLNRAAASGAARQKVQLTHIGDNDEIIRFQRKRPEVVDFKQRDAKIKHEIEQKRLQRRRAQEEANKKKLEESPYVYTPKPRNENDVSAVDGLSPAQRLEVLASPSIRVSDLVQRGNSGSQPSRGSSNENDDDYYDGDSKQPLSSSSSPQPEDKFAPIGRSTTTPTVSQLTSRTKDPLRSRFLSSRTKEEIEADKKSERSRNAQKVLEKCFEPHFEVRTKNLEAYMESVNTKKDSGKRYKNMYAQ